MIVFPIPFNFSFSSLLRPRVMARAGWLRLAAPAVLNGAQPPQMAAARYYVALGGPNRQAIMTSRVRNDYVYAIVFLLGWDQHPAARRSVSVSVLPVLKIT